MATPQAQPELALDHTPALETAMRSLFESRWKRWHRLPFEEAMKDAITRRLLCLTFVEKGNKARMMPVPREAEMLLRVYLGHEELKAVDREIEPKPGQHDRVLFVSVRSTRLTPDQHRGENRRLTRKAVHDMVQRYGRRLGIPDDELHPHAFRHLFGTELTEDDVSLASTQELMGHADPKSTAIYIQLAQRKKAQLIDQSAPLAKMRTPVSDLLKRLPPG